MKWKFWSRSDNEPSSPETGVKGLAKPKTIPEIVGRYLVVEMQEDPDWVWELKAVVRPKEGNPETSDIRLFDEQRATAYGVRVRDYTTLDAHPHLIVYEGWYTKKDRVVQIVHTEYKAAG